MVDGGDALAAQPQPPMRARPDPGIIAIAPINQIVPAFRAGPGVIGDFIGGAAGGFGQFLGRFIKLRRQVLVRNFQRAVSVKQGEWRAPVRW